MFKLTLEKQIALAFLIVILLLVVIGIFAYRTTTSLSKAVTWEKHTQQVVLSLDELLILTITAETNARGYIITENDIYLEALRQAQQGIPNNVNNLRNLLIDNSDQSERLKKLEGQLNEKLLYIQQGIEVRRTQGINASINMSATGRGMKKMDDIRVSVAEMKAEENRLLELREGDVNSNLQQTYGMILLTGFAGIISIGLANFAIIRETGKRRKAEEELKETNKELENRVEERTNQLTQSNEELTASVKSEKIARKDAEIANRLRDEFLATVSHELRAPLNSILGWSKLIQQGKLDKPTVAKAIETIVRNANSQNRLIEDLLDVSRIISGKLRLEIIKVKIGKLVESALESVRPAAEAKNITLEVKEDATISHVTADPTRIQQVIWNLLSNAIKFTPNDGKVSVEIKRLGSEVEIRVKDTGVGIKEEFLPFVFERFRQADNSSIRKFGGLGLGLAIVRHITEMHGGTVQALSEGENKGSTFVVKLPLSVEVESVADLAPKVEPNNDSETKIDVGLDGLLILVVDDEPDTRQMLVQALTHYGATIITASSVKEALTQIMEKSPDVLISDIGMPEEDGYSLIRKIRTLPNGNANIQAIAVTAFTRSQDRMRAVAAGFQNHVSKPVEIEELVTVIGSLTGRLEANEKNKAE